MFFHILSCKCAWRHSLVQCLISHLTRSLRTRRFSEPTFGPSRPTNHWKNTAIRDVPNISRGCIFFLLICAHLRLLSSDSTSLLCFSSFHPENPCRLERIKQTQFAGGDDDKWQYNIVPICTKYTTPHNNCYTNTTIYKSICNLSFCSRHLLGLFGPQHALYIQGAMFSSARFDVCRNNTFARRWVSCHVVIPNFPDATRADQNASYILVACSHNKHRMHTDLQTERRYAWPVVQSSFVPVIGGSSFSFASNTCEHENTMSRYRRSEYTL